MPSDNYDAHAGLERIRAYVEGIERERDEAVALLRKLSDAAFAYDSAIQSCANDPDKMASHCTAEGETLDDLYMNWLTEAHEARSFLARTKG